MLTQDIFERDFIPYMNFSEVVKEQVDNTTRYICKNNGVAQVTYVFQNNKMIGLKK